jgi:hypothetical protein
VSVSRSRSRFKSRRAVKWIIIVLAILLTAGLIVLILGPGWIMAWADQD